MRVKQDTNIVQEPPHHSGYYDNNQMSQQTTFFLSDAPIPTRGTIFEKKL